jgi:KUP system potassium uptake protein
MASGSRSSASPGSSTCPAPGDPARALAAYGVEFLSTHGWVGFIALGAVVLAITGAEALYADMGHFGRPAIRRAWFFAVFPALTLNYMGQGTLIIGDPKASTTRSLLLFRAGCSSRW